MRKHKLNRMDAWIIPSKHVVEHKKLKDNYSLSLKSMSITISPFFVAPGFKDKTRYTLYVSPGSQISHIATIRVI